MDLEIKPIKYFENFDALRFILAINVLLFHYYGFVYAKTENVTLLHSGLSFIFRNGIAAVSFFFVLSGFLITYLSFTELIQNGRIDVKFFLFKRILRIWPLYFIVLILGILIYGIKTNWVFYVTFLSNIEVVYNNKLQNGIIFPLWSVSIEEQFYLFFPLSMFLFKLNTSKKFLLFFSLLIVASTIYQFLSYQDINKIRYGTLSCVTDLAVGGIAAILCLSNTKWLYFLKKMSRIAIIGVYTLGIFYLYGRVYFFSNAYLLATQHLVLSLFFVFILLEQTYSERSFYKIKNVPWITSLGKYTYGIYLYHAIVGAFLHWVLDQSVFNGILIFDLCLRPLIFIVLTIIVSFLSYKYIEEPIISLRRLYQARSKK